MAIFSPTTKPATLVTGTLVEPTGIVITGPSGSGCHSVVLAAGRRPDAYDLAGLHAGAGVDADRIAGVHAGRAPDVDGGIARARGDRQPGVGEAEQVEAASRELRPGRDLHRREDGLLGRVLRSGSSWRCRRYGRRRCRAR